VNLIVVLIDLLAVAGVVDAWIRWRNASARDRAELHQRNLELTAHREEIARRNEELQTLFTRVDHEHSQLQAVLETVPFGVCMIGDDGKTVRFNPAGRAILRLPSEVPTNYSAWPVQFTLRSDGRDWPPDQYPLVKAMAGISMPPTEMDLCFADGREVSLLVSAAPIRGADGSIHGAVSAFIDIGQQKMLRGELETRRRDAEEESIRKSRFLAAVSHDIRTPANAISLLSEVLRRAAAQPDLAGEIPDMVGELHTVSTALVNLVSDVLDITRLDTGRVEPHPTEFALADLLKEEFIQLSPLAEQKKLSLVCQPVNGLMLKTDRIMLSRVVGNLVANAIKFTESGGVTIACDLLPDGRLQIKVRDTGVGIAADDLHRIFDEFVQLKRPGRNRLAGSGMGLAICRRLIATIGGALEVESQPGQGSVFTAILPPRAVVGEIGHAEDVPAA
jgi:signal transduction histidine kinase